MKGNQRVKCKRKDRLPGHPAWHSPHAALHCEGKLCRWQRGTAQSTAKGFAAKASRCPMKRGN